MDENGMFDRKLKSLAVLLLFEGNFLLCGSKILVTLLTGRLGELHYVKAIKQHGGFPYIYL